jgi:hypothetical protein
MTARRDLRMVLGSLGASLVSTFVVSCSAGSGTPSDAGIFSYEIFCDAYKEHWRAFQQRCVGGPAEYYRSIDVRCPFEESIRPRAPRIRCC